MGHPIEIPYHTRGVRESKALILSHPMGWQGSQYPVSSHFFPATGKHAARQSMQTRPRPSIASILWTVGECFN